MRIRGNVVWLTTTKQILYYIVLLQVYTNNILYSARVHTFTFTYTPAHTRRE